MDFYFSVFVGGPKLFFVTRSEFSQPGPRLLSGISITADESL